MRVLRRALLIVALLLVAAVGVIAWKMGPRNAYGFLRYGTQRREGKLRVGDRAPDASLVSLDGKTPLRLSERIGGKPLVLVFGSYT